MYDFIDTVINLIVADFHMKHANNPYLRLITPPVIKVCGILTWIGEFIPGNKTIYVEFDEESDFLGPRT